MFMFITTDRTVQLGDNKLSYFDPDNKCSDRWKFTVFNRANLIDNLRLVDQIAEVEILPNAKQVKTPHSIITDQIYVKCCMKVSDLPEWRNLAFCLQAVRRSAYYWTDYMFDFKIRHNPAICLALCQNNGLFLQYITDPTYEMCLAAVRQNGFALQYVEEQTVELCLAAVEECGHALQYVKSPTYEICLAACMQNPTSLQFIEDQPYDICMLSVQLSGTALSCVKKQTTDICLAAVRQNGEALYYVKDKTREICEEAIKQHPLAIFMADIYKDELYSIAMSHADLETRIYLQAKQKI